MAKQAFFSNFIDVDATKNLHSLPRVFLIFYITLKPIIFPNRRNFANFYLQLAKCFDLFRSTRRPKRRVAPRRSTALNRRCPASPPPIVRPFFFSFRPIPLARPFAPLNATPLIFLSPFLKAINETPAKNQTRSLFFARPASARSRLGLSFPLTASRRRPVGRKRPATFPRPCG